MLGVGEGPFAEVERAPGKCVSCVLRPRLTPPSMTRNLIVCAGLVPVMRLVERCGLGDLVNGRHARCRQWPWNGRPWNGEWVGPGVTEVVLPGRSCRR